eukprot:6892776-Alexandrium_andersonii.AAC.1
MAVGGKAAPPTVRPPVALSPKKDPPAPRPAALQPAPSPAAPPRPTMPKGLPAVLASRFPALAKAVALTAPVRPGAVGPAQAPAGEAEEKLIFIGRGSVC